MAFTSADELSHDFDLAVEYLERREDDLKKLMKTLEWKPNGLFTIVANVHGAQIVHELKPGTLHAFPCWGELFFKGDTESPIVFHHFHNFAAYVLARWW